MPPDASEAGFTLVEVLVAFVVAGILLAIIFDAEISARERLVRQQDRAGALLLARAIVADEETAPFRPGTRQGDEGALHWTVTEAALRLDPRGLLVLSDIRLRIADRRDRSLFNTTVRRLKAANQQ